MSPQRLKILLIEVKPGDARWIQQLLADERGGTGCLFDVECADGLATGLLRLDARDIDLVLLDFLLPGGRGPETFSRVKAHAPSIAMIALTDFGDEGVALNIGKEGVQEYLPRTQLSAGLLSRAILYAIERKGAEQEICRLNEELQRRTQAHISELETANEALETFYFAVSHDLRTPLQNIICFSQILLEEYGTRIPPKARRLFRMVCDSAEEMGRMIEVLVKFSRLSRQLLTKEVVKPASIVRDALDELRDKYEGRKVEVRVANLPDCSADPALLRLVFMNLLSNAFKFTHGPEQALVEVGSLEQQGKPVYFIRDNGVGFDMQYASKLFRIFQRLHPSSEFHGTGAGLSIADLIVQRHGGKIWAEAEVNKGATFYFTLPPDHSLASMGLSSSQNSRP